MSKKPPTGSSELRSAFKSLQVNTPLRLSKSGPGMKPPVEAPLNEVGRSEAPQTEVPPARPSQNEGPQSGPENNLRSSLENESRSSTPKSLEHEAPQNSEARTELPRSEGSQSEEPDFESAHLQRPQKKDPRTEVPNYEQTQVERAQNEAPQKVTDRSNQKEVPQYESAEPTQNEAPHNDVAQVEGALFEHTSNQGFFKLSHAVFSEPLLQQLSGDCFRLFLWLSSRAWRFAKSNGHVRASVRFIEDQTGMSHATVSRALKTLKDRNLVRLAETDFKRGNTWQVSSIAFGNRGPDGLPPQDERPQNKAPKSDLARPSNRGTSHLKIGTKVPQNVGNIRSYNNQKDIKKDPVGTIIPEFDTTPQVDSQLREEALECFELEVGESEKTRIIQTFTEEAFPSGFLPPLTVIHAMAAIAWFTKGKRSSAGVAV